MEKTNALSQCGDFEGTMKLTPPVLEDITWWINNIHLSYYVIDHGEPQAILYKDASTTGWGCEFQRTPQGDPGAQLRHKITLITLKCWLSN